MWLLIFSCLMLYGGVVNTLRPRENGRHFADDTFKRIFMNENVRISINFSLKFVPKCLINNIPALVQIMAWLEPMMVNLLTHICVTRLVRFWFVSFLGSKNAPILKISQGTCPISHDAPFRTEMHISVLNGALWDIGQVHCRVYELGQSWIRFMLCRT